MRLLRAAFRILRFLPTSQAATLATIWGVVMGLAWGMGGLSFLEEPLGDRIWRASQSNEPTVATWVVFVDGASGTKGHRAADAATWRSLLDRAREEAVSAVVVLDDRAREPLAEALREGGNSGVRVLVPSRRREDPYRESAATILPFFAEAGRPAAGTFEEGLLDLRPDADGTWRRSALTDGLGRPTLLGKLAPRELSGSGPVRHWLTGRVGDEQRISLWRILDRDLSLPSWRGGIWIAAAEDSARDVWSGEGELLPEARAVAQVADGLKRGRWQHESPGWLVGLLAACGFLLSWFGASTLSPVRGLAALAGVAAVALVGLWFLRVQPLWFVPIVPVIPTLLGGYLFGLAERHRLLRRGMAELLVRLGRSRVLNPILTRPASDERDVAAFRALLDLEAAAVVSDDPARPLSALSTREDRTDLWDWFPAGSRGIVAAAQASPDRPLFYRPPDVGPAVIVENITKRAGRMTWLVMAPKGDPGAWWQENRSFVARAIVPLGSLGPAAAQAEVPTVEGIANPENQLAILRKTVDQTEIERTFLLGFLDRLSEGVLVCDLVGRPLIYNKRFQKMAEELAVDFDDPLIAFLRTISSQTEAQVWHGIAQTTRTEARWTLYASVQRHPVRHYMSNLIKLDLGGGDERSGGSKGVSDVVALVVTEVSDLYEAERLKSELLEHFVHDVRNAVTVIAQSAEEVADVTNDDSVKPDLEMIRSQAMGISDRFRRMAMLAGISADKIADELTPTDLVSEAKRAMNAAAGMAEQLGIILAYDGQTVVPFCTARPNALRQAIMQVIEQALSSSPRGSTVTIGALDEGAEISVKINDPGWSPMMAISRMRATLPTGATMKYAAADGLQKIVEAAGGQMSTEFDEAVGTSVRMTFAKVSNRLEDASGAPIESKADEAGGSGMPAPVPGQLP
jgi:signal transduction histidine kinase